MFSSSHAFQTFDTDIHICGDISSSDIDDSNEEVKVPNDEGDSFVLVIACAIKLLLL